MKTVTLGITTYGGAELLATCLRSIQKSITEVNYTNFEVIVIDDGSPEEEADKLSRTWEYWQTRSVNREGRHNIGYILRCDEQLGTMARYNTIVEESKGDIIALICNDLVVPDRWFSSLLHFLTANKCGAVSWLSQKVTEQEVTELLSKPKIPAVGSGRLPERATELAAYCMAFTRENYELVGGFDSDSFKYFIGDSDFCCKLAEMGLTSYRLLYPVVYHREHSTYNAYPELKAWERVNVDIANFKKKWGCTPKEMEAKLLTEIKPQMISWYANYAVHMDWDVLVQGDLEFIKEPVKVEPLEEVPKEVKGEEE